MKTYTFKIACLFILILSSCNNDFMDRFPETSISPEAFFKTTKDLELYTNTYYEYVSPSFFDYISDNCVSYAETSRYNDLIRGSITPQTVTGWEKDTWGRLRRFNFLLENVNKAVGEENVINHYIGITRLQRAIWYYDMVKMYNDVPWYSTIINDTDENLLYKERDPRTIVVDSIIADLEYATATISEEIGNRTQFSKWYAYAIMARICLHEGTFRKYHKELMLENTANDFLKKAVEATDKIINSGKFNIDKSGDAQNAYWNLFNGYDLSKSPEIILFKDYDTDALIKHSAGRHTFNWISNYSRSLMESYQYITEDGKAIPFSTLKDYDKKSYVEVFKNRDPRFSQCFMPPGYIVAGQIQPNRPNMNLGGYPIIKYMAGTVDQLESNTQYTDLPVLRYAEVLLINAEAKAELGTITQSDIDNTINKIRERVDLPRIILGNIVEDPSLKKQFPNVSDYIILDIRRERRIELVNENFRWDDLMRWSAGHLIGKIQEGIYIDKLGLFDVTGDGVPDVGIFENEASNPIPEEERSNYTFYYLKSNSGSLNTFSLTNGTSGYIVMNGEINSREFKEPQYYYWPIPQTQITLNPSLKQTIFWDQK